MNSFQESNITPIQPNFTQDGNFSLFSNKNTIIILLVILLIFSFLGVNILVILGNLLQSIIQIFGPLITQILSIFGYVTGTVINKTADVVADTAKTGIDIAEGSVQSVGNILRDASQSNVNVNSKQSLDNVLNQRIINNDPKSDTTENPIQKPISSNKQNWCLVGEYQGKRGCIEINEHDKCLSGQVFPNQKMCLNPTLTQT
jgi:hypothetical protein